MMKRGKNDKIRKKNCNNAKEKKNDTKKVKKIYNQMEIKTWYCDNIFYQLCHIQNKMFDSMREKVATLREENV